MPLTGWSPVTSIAHVMARWRPGLVAALVTLTVVCVTWAPVTAHPRDRRSEPAAAGDSVRAPAVLAPSPLETPATSARAVPLPESRPHIPAATFLALWLLALAIVRRPTATLRGVLATLLLVVGVEGAIHSVHHLDSPSGAASCHVLSVTKQMHGEVSPEAPDATPLVVLGPCQPTPLPHPPAAVIRWTGEGRAPPLLSV